MHVLTYESGGTVGKIYMTVSEGSIKTTMLPASCKLRITLGNASEGKTMWLSW